MKAIKVLKNLRVVYVFYCLNALKRQLLKLVTTAGHGTKKFDADAMDKLLIPIPPLDMQDQFILTAEKIEALKANGQKSLSDLNELYGSLSQHAFKGGLPLSRISSEGFGSEEFCVAP
jgi:type I restriction enzyme S subunit